jgi:hypothetical protein
MKRFGRTLGSSGGDAGRRASRWVVVCIIAGMTGFGCVTPQEGVKFTQAREQNDIPVPQDFEFDADSSYAYEPETSFREAEFRSWCGFYRGQGVMGLIVPWYVREMKKSGWQLAFIDDRAHKLRFEKAEEEARIEVYRELDSKSGGFTVVVRAQIRPLGPENFDVEENIGLAKRGSSSRTSNEDAVVEAPGEAVGIAPAASKVSAPGAGTGAGATELEKEATLVPGVDTSEKRRAKTAPVVPRAELDRQKELDEIKEIEEGS